MKLQRLITILTILLQVDKIPAKVLAKKFDVNIRTIYRDIVTLEAAGIPVVTYMGTSGGISILDSYKLDKLLFSSNDIENLLQGIDTVSGNSEDDSLNHTLEKIKNLMPEQVVKSIELSLNQLYIDMSPWANKPLFAEKISIVQLALQKHAPLAFTYISRHETFHQRTAEPHQLILKENNWFLRAFCRENEDFAVFNLTEMSDIQILPEVFKPRNFDKHLGDFKDWESESTINIQLLVPPEQKERALDFCKQEQMHQLPSGDYLINMSFVESEMGYDFLLGLGHKCEIKSPPHVREELVRRIRLLSETYRAHQAI